MTRCHIDTDMGVDDGLALVVANKFIDVYSISTTFGNVPVETATRNALIFRRLLGRDRSWNVFKGAEQARDGFRREVPHIHGIDGLGGATQALDAQLLSESSAESVSLLANAPRPAPGPITLIGIGPATNIPSIVALYGRAAIERIVLMSGAFFDVGNITHFAEFNAYNDPFALAETLAIGIPVTFVPLDVCRKVQISRQSMIEYGIEDTSKLAQLVSKAHMSYMDFYRQWEGIDGCFPHDFIAVLVAFAPEHFFSVRGTVTVDRSPNNRGQTSISIDDTSHIEIVTGGDLKWVRDTLRELTHSD